MNFLVSSHPGFFFETGVLICGYCAIILNSAGSRLIVFSAR